MNASSVTSTMKRPAQPLAPSVPANERFESDDLLAANVDLRLERAGKLAIADGEAQALLQLHARGHAATHVAIEERGGALRSALGAVHRAVGVSPQFFVIAAVLRIDAHADRCRGEHLEALDVKRLLQFFQQALDRRVDLIVAD